MILAWSEVACNYYLKNFMSVFIKTFPFITGEFGFLNWEGDTTFLYYLVKIFTYRINIDIK